MALVLDGFFLPCGRVQPKTKRRGLVSGAPEPSKQRAVEHRRPPCRGRPSSLRSAASTLRGQSIRRHGKPFFPIRAPFILARLTPGLFICFYSTNYNCHHYNHHRANKNIAQQRLAANLTISVHRSVKLTHHLFFFSRVYRRRRACGFGVVGALNLVALVVPVLVTHHADAVTVLISIHRKLPLPRF